MKRGTPEARLTVLLEELDILFPGLVDPTSSEPPEQKYLTAIAALKNDADRWRWWKPLMRVGRDEPGDWTCWVEMECVPYRSQTTSVDELTDALKDRFPLRDRGDWTP